MAIWKNKKIKILIINPSANLGGGNTISNSLAMESDKNLFEFFSFFPEKGMALTNLRRKKNIKILIPSNSNFFSILKFLYSFLKKNKLDILHTQGTRAALWTRLAVIPLLNKPKIIYTLHGLHIIRKGFFFRWFLILIERFLNHWTDILICVSLADKNLVLQYKLIAPEKIRVIKNGISIANFNKISKKKAQDLKIKLNLENKTILTAIGRLHPPKDFETILNALKLIVPKAANVKLLIVGDGPLRKKLEDKTKQLNLEKYVKFLGWRKDIPLITNISDVMILSSNWEGLSVVCLEAGASHRAIVASNIEGIREAIIDCKTGLLFKKGSFEDLAQKLLKIIFDKKMRKKIGEEAFRFIRANFHQEKMIEEYKKLYFSLYENSSNK